jgi:RecA/RadA recombinase
MADGRTRRVRKDKVKEKSLAEQVIDRHNKPLKPKPQLELTATGSTPIDLSLNGGFGWGVMVNIIGDYSTGKTGLVLETIARAYHALGKKLIIDYADAEARLKIDTKSIYNFDIYPYVYRPDSIQQFCYHLNQKLEKLKNDQYLISVIDSFDALTSNEELERFAQDQKIFDDNSEKKSKGSYGAERAKFSSYLKNAYLF